MNEYINIKFQEGPIRENGVNGCQIEDVIDVLVERLEGFQCGGYPCQENGRAITKLKEARLWLNERTRKRLEQGVEGKNIIHGQLNWAEAVNGESLTANVIKVGQLVVKDADVQRIAEKLGEQLEKRPRRI